MAKKTPIKLTHDFWGEDGRVKAGSVIDVDVKTAKEMLAAKKAERADPLPE